MRPAGSADVGDQDQKRRRQITIAAGSQYACSMLRLTSSRISVGVGIFMRGSEKICAKRGTTKFSSTNDRCQADQRSAGRDRSAS